LSTGTEFTPYLLGLAFVGFKKTRQTLFERVNGMIFKILILSSNFELFEQSEFSKLR
jgi:hypothetical protein